MNVKLFVVLVICVTFVDSQSTISCRNLQLNDDEFLEDVKSETEPIRQLWLTQQEMKLELKEMREIVLKQQNRHRNACPPGFDYLPEAGSCFKVIFEAMTWDSATERCRQVMPGMHLALITSQAENDAIARYLELQFSGRNNSCRATSLPWPGAGNLVWIGGQTKNPRLCGDPYVWKPLKGIEIPFNYTNWKRNNPDCYKDGESCVHITTGFNNSWNDYLCDWLSCPICEIHV